MKTTRDWSYFRLNRASRRVTGIPILDGAFADCIGLFDGMRDFQRVSVLLELLGRKVRVMLKGDAIAAA